MGGRWFAEGQQAITQSRRHRPRIPILIFVWEMDNNCDDKCIILLMGFRTSSRTFPFWDGATRNVISQPFGCVCNWLIGEIYKAFYGCYNFFQMKLSVCVNCHTLTIVECLHQMYISNTSLKIIGHCSNGFNQNHNLGKHIWNRMLYLFVTFIALFLYFLNRIDYSFAHFARLTQKCG